MSEKAMTRATVARLRELMARATPLSSEESAWTWQEGQVCAACGVELEPDMAPPGPHHCLRCWDRVRVEAFREVAKHLPDLLRVVEATAESNPFADMTCVFCGCDEYGPTPRAHLATCGYALSRALTGTGEG